MRIWNIRIRIWVIANFVLILKHVFQIILFFSDSSQAREESEILQETSLGGHPFESPSEKELPTSVDKLAESTSYDELKSTNDILFKENETGTDKLTEQTNLNPSEIERQGTTPFY